ncbi:hypothetical protein [Ktedonobacter racemifer]|uniref:Uncharacterized protein n=1 Tax=Ktedonobacter racemifer DSM 44963 TaxID=485913 RepID=D6TM12_KTERA|nr:hypothetical protein [Ktedonobacter racemifer]EFH86812.1 hypothetical protein Krac_8128 [Ktedonobacter racemifer DSM 44963]
MIEDKDGHHYHVVVDENGTPTRYRVVMPDEHHHSNYEDAQKFFSALANIMNIAVGSITSYQFLKTIRKK